MKYMNEIIGKVDSRIVDHPWVWYDSTCYFDNKSERESLDLHVVFCQQRKACVYRILNEKINIDKEHCDKKYHERIVAYPRYQIEIVGINL